MADVVLASAVLLFFFLRVLLPDLVTPQIASSFLFHVISSIFLLLLYLYLDICINYLFYLFLVESHLHIYTFLHPNICLLNIHSGCGVKHVVYSYNFTKLDTGLKPQLLAIVKSYFIFETGFHSPLI